MYKISNHHHPEDLTQLQKALPEEQPQKKPISGRDYGM